MLEPGGTTHRSHANVHVHPAMCPVVRGRRRAPPNVELENLKPQVSVHAMLLAASQRPREQAEDKP